VIAHEVAHVAGGSATAAYVGAADAEPFTAGLFHPLARLFARGAPRIKEASLETLFPEADPDVETTVDAETSRLLGKAGFSPGALPDVLDTLERLEIESDARGVPTWPVTHGRDEDRRRVLRETLHSATRSPGPDAAAAGLAGGALPNLLFGDDPRDGLQRGNEVLKANLRFAIQIPLDWEISADRTRLLVRGPADAALLVQLVPAARSRSLQDIVSSILSTAGLHQPTGSMTMIGQVPAYTGAASGRIDGLGDVRASFGCLRSGGRAFLMTGVAAADLFPGVESQFIAAIQSFRTLDQAEADRVRPERLAFDTVRAGDSWESIARRHGGLVMAATLALLNHAERPPAAGTLVKVVVASDR
jgi:predicted Zn-dependent protease